MSSISEKLIGTERVRIAPSAHRAPASIWDVLDQFVRTLENWESPSGKLQHVVHSVRDSLHADLVFAGSAGEGAPVEIVSKEAVTPAWCRRFVELQLAALPANRDSHCCMAAVPVELSDSPLRPQSTIMVRIARSRPTWIVAVNFDNQRVFRLDDLKVVLLIRRIYRDHRRQMQARDKLTDAVLGVVRGLNEAITAKSPFTSGHSERVARMAVRLGKQMRLSPSLLSDLYLAGLLHDVGKIGIRDNVLQKQDRLTDDEQAHIREHPVIGDTIVSKIKNLAHLRPGVRNHHERFDGQGYPDGLAGHAIPLLARILSVVDACDAMMSPRPYRAGLPTEQVDNILTAGAGTQWDPALIEHFMECRKELYSIYQKGIGDSVVHAVEEIVRTSQNEGSLKRE